MKPSKPHGISDMQGGFTWTEKVKSKSKPKQYIPGGAIDDYIAKRNNIMGFPVSSAKPAKIVHEMEDKLKRQDRFAEDNIVNALAKWFKQEYPGLPFTIDKVAQKRSSLGGMIHKSSAYMKGNPDIFIQVQRAGYAGLYIEQKKDDSIFYKGTKILRPGSENQHIYQSLYHADLREQGYWVMFSISLDASKKIVERYMAGNPFANHGFKYYCKPEHREQFAFHKHFNPVDKV